MRFSRSERAKPPRLPGSRWMDALECRLVDGRWRYTRRKVTIRSGCRKLAGFASNGPCWYCGAVGARAHSLCRGYRFQVLLDMTDTTRTHAILAYVILSLSLSLSRSVSLWLSYEFNVVVCDPVVVKWLVAFAGFLCGESCLSRQLRPLDPNTEPEIEKRRFAVVERQEIVFRLWYWKKIRGFGVVEVLSKLKTKN